MLIDPTTLTPGEKLEVSRRRADMTQKEAAALYGWPFRRYLRAERGEIVDIPAPELASLTEGEECRLRRRREGLTLQEVEELSGFKAKWIHRVEMGQTLSAKPLVGFWKARERELQR